MKDVYSNIKILHALDITDFDTDVESSLIDISPYKGHAMALLRILEDASQVNTEKLDVTCHKVDSDSDTLDSDNLIASFDQVVGLNGSEIQRNFLLDIDLDLVDTQYIQFLLTETNTYECYISLSVLFAGASHLPIQ